MFHLFAAALFAPALAPSIVPQAPEAAPVLIDYQTPVSRIVTYGPETELRRLVTAALPADVQAVFDYDFAPLEYFAAFAYSKSAGSWGYSYGLNSIEAARAMALGECGTNGGGCAVIAEIVPRGYAELGPGEVSIAYELLGFWNDPWSVGAPRDTHLTMAMSGDGAWTMVWGHPDQASADRQALADCESYRDSNFEGYGDFACVVLPGVPGRDILGDGGRSAVPAPVVNPSMPDVANVVIEYGPASEVRRVTTVTLPADVQAILDGQLASDGYFSALAYSKSSGAYGASAPVNSLEAARAISMDLCNQNGTGCNIVAEIVPRGYREPRPGEVTLSPEMVDIWYNPWARGAARNEALTMAISPDGAWTIVWGNPSEFDTYTKALNDCEGYRDMSLPSAQLFSCIVLPGEPGVDRLSPP